MARKAVLRGLNRAGRIKAIAEIHGHSHSEALWYLHRPYDLDLTNSEDVAPPRKKVHEESCLNSSLELAVGRDN